MGCFTCEICGRQTRQTGRGDNEFTGLCAECYDVAGIENSISDGLVTVEQVLPEVTVLLNKIVRLGGKPQFDYIDRVKITAKATVKKVPVIHRGGGYYGRFVDRSVGICVGSAIGAQKFSGFTTGNDAEVTCKACLKHLEKR